MKCLPRLESNWHADPLWDFALKPESFGSMLSYGSQLADPAQLAGIRKDLPIYVFSGDHDPLSRDLHALQPVIDRYRAAGLRVDVDIYPGARHGILNETNRADVHSCSIDFATEFAWAN